jgi:hypothetical protein
MPEDSHLLVALLVVEVLLLHRGYAQPQGIDAVEQEKL